MGVAPVVLFWLAAIVFLLDFLLYWLTTVPAGGRGVPRLTALGLAFLAAGLALASH